VAVTGVLVWLLSLAVAVTPAAEIIRPPFEASLKSRYVLIIAHPTPDASGELRIKRRLWDPEQLLQETDRIRVSKLQHATECRILVLSKYIRHPLYRDEFLDDPQGFTVQELNLVGAGEFACSEDFVAVVEHVLAAKTEPDAVPMPPLDALLKLLDSTDQPSRRMAAFQLAMHADWLAQATSVQANSLRSQLVQAHWSDELLEMLLLAAAGLPAQSRQGWLHEQALQILRQRPPPHDLASYTPQLLRTGMAVLDDRSSVSESDRALIMQMLQSNAPGVAKSALQLLARVDAEALAAQLHDWQAVPQLWQRLHTETQRQAQQWLRERSPTRGSG